MPTESNETPRDPITGEVLTGDDLAFFQRYGYTKFEAAEMSYVGKLLDACETEEERIVITDFFAG